MDPAEQNSTPSALSFDTRTARIVLVVVIGLAAIYWQGWLILRVAMGAATAAMVAAAVACGVVACIKQAGQRAHYCVASIALLCIATIVWWLMPSGLRNSAVTSNAVANQPTAVELRETVKSVLQHNFNEHKQALFNKLHPFGTAQRVVVHDVEIHWKPGASQRDLRDALSIDTRFTIYWSGPINKDGYTYVSATYEVEPDRSRETVLSTNGTLNEQLPELAFNLGFFVGSLFEGGAR